MGQALVTLGRYGEARRLLTATAEKLRPRGPSRTLEDVEELLAELDRLEGVPPAE